MKHFKEKLEIETLKALTYTQINELLNKLTLENKELKEQLRIGDVSQQRELLLAFLKCYNNGEVTKYGINEVDDFLKHNS